MSQLDRALVRPTNHSDSALSRRSFLQSTAAAAVIVSASPQLLMAETTEGASQRALGRTGEKVLDIGLGGYHIGKKELTEAESIRIIRSAIDRGITFMDNCWDYNGASEIPMGMDAHFRSFEREVLPLLMKDQVGVLGMKALVIRSFSKARPNGEAVLHSRLKHSLVGSATFWMG